MRRRDMLGAAGGAAAAATTLLASRDAQAQDQVSRATRGMAMPKIKDISVIECAPKGSRLTVVKITTDQAGLYGYGCATFTQRADLVKPAVELYLKPLLLGRTVDRIEDIWQMSYNSSYWQWPGGEQRHQRRGPGPVGHQGPHGRHAGLSAA